jgi:hypothetical protein
LIVCEKIEPMSDDPFFCEDCDMDLGHDEIETVSQVPQVDVETFEISGQPADVHKCAGCGLVIGLTLQ